MRHGPLFVTFLAIALLTGCGGASASDRDSLIAKCERSAGRAATSPGQASAMCACTADGLIAEGLGAMDMITGERGKAIARQCAVSAGMPVAN